MKFLVCAFLLTSLGLVVCASPMNDDTPLDCPKNEIYYKCSLEECYTKCEHLKKPPACPQLAPGCYEPACLCKAGYLRNEEGLCVNEHQCPEFTNVGYSYEDFAASP